MEKEKRNMKDLEVLRMTDEEMDNLEGLFISQNKKVPVLNTYIAKTISAVIIPEPIINTTKDSKYLIRYLLTKNNIGGSIISNQLPKDVSKYEICSTIISAHNNTDWEIVNLPVTQSLTANNGELDMEKCSELHKIRNYEYDEDYSVSLVMNLSSIDSFFSILTSINGKLLPLKGIKPTKFLMYSYPSGKTFITHHNNANKHIGTGASIVMEVDLPLGIVENNPEKYFLMLDKEFKVDILSINEEVDLISVIASEIE